VNTYPTPWQKKILWAALTALALAFIGALTAYLIVKTGKALGRLQPLLIPVAVAGILAYLLNPLVDIFVKWRFRRGAAVLAVLALVLVPMALVGFWVAPEIYHQSGEFAEKVPGYFAKGKEVVTAQVEATVEWFKVQFPENPYLKEILEWMQKQIPEIPLKAWNFISGGFQGFWGVAGFLLGLILVPIYLYYFLMNAESISQRWGDYLPLRASPFKSEVIDCLNEINRYLIAFFRGQILVTLIDGLLIGLSLYFLGVKLALLIGLMVALLQIIPYLGIALCWIPAVLIAYAQPGGGWHLAFWVCGVFFAVLQIEGYFITPKIVGKAVGLHPMTIILSMVAWSLLIGGLLGALLAVPMTATLKVLLRRYVWEKHFEK